MMAEDPLVLCGITISVLLMVSLCGAEKIDLALTSQYQSETSRSSVTLICRVVQRQILERSICRITLFKSDSSLLQNTSRIPLATRFAGKGPQLLIPNSSSTHKVVGNTQSLTLTLEEVTCATEGIYGCVVTYIRDPPSDSAKGVSEVCRNAEKKKRGSSHDPLRSSSANRSLHVELPVKVMLNWTRTVTSGQEVELTLNCFTDTTEEVEGWNWEMMGESGWLPVDPETDHATSDIRGGTSSCRLFYSTLVTRKLGVAEAASRQYRCRLLAKHARNRPESAAVAYYPIKANRSSTLSGIRSSGESRSGGSQLSAESYQDKASMIAIPVILTVAAFLAATAMGYQACCRSHSVPDIEDGKSTVISITQPFTMQTIGPDDDLVRNFNDGADGRQSKVSSSFGSNASSRSTSESPTGVPSQSGADCSQRWDEIIPDFNSDMKALVQDRREEPSKESKMAASVQDRREVPGKESKMAASAQDRREEPGKEYKMAASVQSSMESSVAALVQTSTESGMKASVQPSAESVVTSASEAASASTIFESDIN